MQPSLSLAADQLGKAAVGDPEPESVMGVAAVSDPARTAAKARQHQRFPRWFRMATRIAVMVGLVALPALAVKDPSFEKLTQYRGFSIVFVALGGFVIPMWIPLLGNVVLAFTLVVPIGLAGLWLAYGLFAACPSIIFMMLMCVVLGGGVFFLAEWLSLPVGLLSVLPTVFIVGANLFVQQPGRAWVITVIVSVLLFVAAFVSTLACTVVFPEYCVDEVFRHHHEALEHLLHLAYYAMGLKPPAALKRAYTSDAANLGAAKWKAAFKAADELPSNLQALAGGGVYGPLSSDPSSSTAADSEASAPRTASELKAGAAGAASGGSSVPSVAAAMAAAATPVNKANIKTEREWHRVAMACQAGAQAQMGASAELVVMAAKHKRIILPCSPLMPCAKGQIDTAGLLALRHLALSTALHIIKIYNATQPLEPSTQALLQQLLSEAEWTSMRASLLASLRELTDVFPMDYYPSEAPPDRRHLTALQDAVAALNQAWQKSTAAHQQQQQQGQQQQGQQTAAPRSKDTPQGYQGQGQLLTQQQQEGGVTGAAAAAGGSEHAAVTVPLQGQHEPAAAAEVFQEPLVLTGSPGAYVLARMNTLHIIKLLQDLVGLLQQLYDTVEAVAQAMVSCRCC